VSQYYQKNHFKPYEVVSSEDINENFREALTEINGNLGEQNFRLNSFTSEDMKNDTAIRMYHRNVWVNAFEPVTTWSGAYTSDNGQRENFLCTRMHLLGNSEEFQPIADLSVDLVTDNSVLWIMSSVQISLWPIDSIDMEGLQLALRVDGAIVYETLSGGLDLENEPDGVGTDNRCVPVTIDAVVPVTGGVHKIEIVYKVNHSDSVNKGTSLSAIIKTVTGAEAIDGYIAEGSAIDASSWWLGTKDIQNNAFRALNRNLIIVELR
tara:strand:+ start:1216 stop:2010 length:795 start_codon:yes stop_codon:yes gene_type:complete